ncbi:MAG: sigma-70 family RNA polymerase sigma factor [Sphingomonadaceae bacterium]
MIGEGDLLGRLMARAQGGDRGAYATLLGECRAWLERYYRNKVAAHRIDDLVQETLMSVHVKRASYDPARPFLPWLAAIARYRWIDQLRRHYRLKESALDDAAPVAVESHGAAVIAEIGIDGLLENLAPKQAEAIRLTKIREMSVAEAAAVSGQSESLIKVNVHRGMKRLQKIVERE